MPIDKKSSSWMLMMVLIFQPLILFSQQDCFLSTDSLIEHGIKLSVQHQYQPAAACFDQLLKNSPQHPAGYFFKAALFQSQMMDFETDQWEADFLANIQLALKFSSMKNLPAGVTESDALFFKGSALSYLAFFEGRQGKYLSAIQHGLSGITLLKKLVAKQPDFYDAYFGIGSFLFWRSQMTRHFHWLPLVADERERGLELVTLAITSGKFTRWAAMNEIVWLLLAYEKPRAAFNWSLKGLAQFPDSRFFLWGAAKSAYALSDYAAAIQYFQKILDSISRAEPNNYYNEYLCRLKLARCFFETENYPETKVQLESLKALKLSPEIKKKLSPHRTEAEALAQQLSRIQPPKDLTSENDPADKQRSQQSGQIPD